jgi:hypothetical protein
LKTLDIFNVSPLNPTKKKRLESAILRALARNAQQKAPRGAELSFNASTEGCLPICRHCNKVGDLHP